MSVASPNAERGVAVELTELRRSYGPVNALDSMTLHLAPGEFVALLGPSGCGKTTALRCLAGLEDPDAGTITIGGRDVTALPTNKRDLGMVFQAYSLFPHMTARQNVEFGLEMRGQDKSTRARRAGGHARPRRVVVASGSLRPPDVGWSATAGGSRAGVGDLAAGPVAG